MQEPQANMRSGMDETGFYIRTYTGKKLHFDRVEEHEFDIEDIAHALSLRVRWTGHVKSFYSIAQHSLQVMYLVPVEHKLSALLHDANEAYMPDYPSPLKWWLRDVKHEASMRELELRVDAAIAKQFNLPPRPPCVKEADLIMLATESRDLMPKGEERLYMVKPLEETIEPLGWRRAEQMFLDMYEKYRR